MNIYNKRNQYYFETFCNDDGNLEIEMDFVGGHYHVNSYKTITKVVEELMIHLSEKH